MIAISRLLVAVLILLSGCGHSATSEKQIAPPNRKPPIAAPAPAKNAPPRVDPATSPDDRIGKLIAIDETVSARASIVPNKAPPGGRVTLTVHVKLAAGWHIAPMGKPEGPATPTELSLTLPNGITPSGDWKVPQPERFFSAVGESRGYEGGAKFTHELAIDPAQSAGQLEIGCELHYQACNDRMCDRPSKAMVTARLEIIEK